jgi:hypothetical protein
MTLADGVTTCPTCGSPGIPDPRVNAPLDTAPPPMPAVADEALPPELTEWWREEDETNPGREGRRVMTEMEADQRRTQALIIMVCAALACIFIGWLIGPTMLVGPMENFTGTPVEDPSSLRSLGAFLGLLAGMLVGAVSGWVIWSSK